jgi:deoxycytidylate deaminase
VACLIKTKDGVLANGSNNCESPQPACPRAEGEGYEKCATICRQAGHAEAVALDRAREMGLVLSGATAYLYGHYHVCQECAKALRDAGVEQINILVTP